MKNILILFVLFSLPLFAGDIKMLKAGDKAPSFTLKNYDGKEYQLTTFLKGNKYTVLMWISTQCPVSNAYNERMVKLYSTYTGKGVAFVGMNSNKAENASDMEAHSKDKKFKFPVLKDEKNKIADLYGAMVTPEVYVIDSKGTIVYHGRIDDNKNSEKVEKHDLANALGSLLSGNKIASAETKAFGCSVKRVSED